MSEPIKTFNEARAQRATSERRFQLGPFTFARRISVAPEAIIGFQQGVQGANGDDLLALDAMERTIHTLCDSEVLRTETGEVVPFEKAWREMRTAGDEYGPLDIRDIGDVVEWLIGGIAERPTGEPSDSPDGSEIPSDGTSSTVASPSQAQVLSL